MPFDQHRHHVNQVAYQRLSRTLSAEDRTSLQMELLWALQGHVEPALWKSLAEACHHGIVTNQWADEPGLSD